MTISGKKDLIPFLRQIAYLHNLTDVNLEQLSEHFQEVSVVAGECIIKEGDPGDCLYIVQSGRFLVYKNHEDLSQFRKITIGRGELIGELALLTQEPRTANVKAIRDSILWKLPKASFDAFAQTHPKLLMSIVKNAIIRLSSTHQKPHKPSIAKLLTIMPTGEAHTNLFFVNSLVEAMNKNGKVAYITLDSIKQQFPDLDLLQEFSKYSPLLEWIENLENDFDFIVLQTQPDNIPWTRLCLHQADKVLLYASSNDSPLINDYENELFNHLEKEILLILIHPNATVIPKHSVNWLKQRNVELVHIRNNNLKDLTRLVDIITGKALALVLAGGGAKGLAHIGVYKAFLELGISIDRVGGTSMGAIVAGTIAMGFSFEEIMEKANRLIINNKKFFDYTFPKYALLNGAAWTNSLHQLFLDTEIEDLWINYFCLASNFTLRQEEILTKGLVYKAVRASASLPAIVPPISNERDELLMDGSLFNNIPVDVMKILDPYAKIIAVDVAQKDYKPTHLPDGTISGFRELFSKQDVGPKITDAIIGAILCGNDSKRKKMVELADHYFVLDTKNIMEFDFKKLHELVEIGYQAAMDFFQKKRDEF